MQRQLEVRVYSAGYGREEEVGEGEGVRERGENKEGEREKEKTEVTFSRERCKMVQSPWTIVCQFH